MAANDMALSARVCFICIAVSRGKFLKLNPNQGLPILVDGDTTLWEADAIACRLSLLAGSTFWPTGDALPDLVRWLSWGYWHFVRACDQVHFERVTKQRYGLGRVRQEIVDAGLAEFASSAARSPTRISVSRA